ncbi:hypothetical protein B2J93_8214 [Marssonina coronariae]|uniref:Uncharacterized protein n=1 Tax=Diplocarpon coronariae TaxID=2795749 RepID=A0A218YTS6_9HELO|nr:hypothetical protein B2J93_8214 [Marssonina coronariae]
MSYHDHYFNQPPDQGAAYRGLLPPSRTWYEEDSRRRGRPPAYRSDAYAVSYAHSPPRSPSSETTFYSRSAPNSCSTPRPESPVEHQATTDTRSGPYTYDNEEPGQERLIAYLVDQSGHPNRAAASVDREFSAHAAQHITGRADPASPRSEKYARDPPRSRSFPEEEPAAGPRYRAASPRHRERVRSRAPSPPRPRESCRAPFLQRRASSSRPVRSAGRYHSPPPRTSPYPEPGAPRYASAPWYRHPRSPEPSRERVHRPRSEAEEKRSCWRYVTQEQASSSSRCRVARAPRPPPAASAQEKYEQMERPSRYRSTRER